MNDANPYAAPRSDTPIVAGHAPSFSLARGFVTVLLSGALGSLFGLIAGAVLGSLAPDYYRAVFGNPGLNPIQVGTGLGVTQGFGIGIVVGAVVVLAAAIANRRTVAAPGT